MKKFVFSFVVTLVLVATAGQAWADNPIPLPPSNPKVSAIAISPLADNPIPLPPNPKIR